jgi:hypothetical protein
VLLFEVRPGETLLRALVVLQYHRGNIAEELRVKRCRLALGSIWITHAHAHNRRRERRLSGTKMSPENRKFTQPSLV